MALAPNTAVVTILEDSHLRTTVKLAWIANNATETDVMKVNAASLKGATMDLSFNAAQLALVTDFYQFGIVGEKIVANGGSSAAGYVVTYTANASGNSIIRVVLDDPTVAFAGTDQIVGQRGQVVTLNAATRPKYILAIESVEHSITGSQPSVELEWKNSDSSFATAVLVHGESYIGKNSTIATKIPNNGNNATVGDLFLSTHNFANNDSYFLVIELGKLGGYAMPGQA